MDREACAFERYTAFIEAARVKLSPKGGAANEVRGK
jgi:hypothetical protein